MKYIKPLIFYIGYMTIYFVLLLVISRLQLSLALFYFGKTYLYFNIIFATLYSFLTHKIDIISLSILTLYAITITIFVVEFIYPKFLKDHLILYPDIEKSVVSTEIIPDFNKKSTTVPSSNFDRAKYYMEIGEFSSAWIYADFVIENGVDNIVLAQKIKAEAESKLKSPQFKGDNDRYIETVKYIQLINQKRYLDAYYFSLSNLNSVVYDEDFYLKLKNSYHILLDDYYSIDVVESTLKMPGYTDIKFYYTKGKVIEYSIEKIVYDNGQCYIKNLIIDGDIYPYIFIDKDSKIFASGFRENREFVIEKDAPYIPMSAEDLKLFSKEFYTLSNSSLYFNIKIFSKKYVKYFEDFELSNLILSRYTGYLLIIIIFFMAQIGTDNRYFISYLFSYMFFLLYIRWIIKKIGLTLIVSGLSLSLIIVSLLFCLWLLFIIKRSNLLHAQSLRLKP